MIGPTPLLDCFKRGEMDRDVKMLAAQGQLAPRAYEQIAILVLLLEDPDREIRQTADDTLNLIPEEKLKSFVARSDIPIAMREFFADRGVFPAEIPTIVDDEDLPLVDVDSPDDAIFLEPGGGQDDLPPMANVPTSTDLIPDDEPPKTIPPATPATEPGAAPTSAQGQAAAADGQDAKGKDEKDEADEPEGDSKLSASQLLNKMSFTQRLKAAVKGTREMRAILIRDPNKMIASSVLSSPKVSESEIASFAKMQAVSEDVLRMIGNNRAWIKNYNVVLGLAKNPKTPVAMSLNFLNRLSNKDVAMLAVDRNVSEALRIAARKKASAARAGSG